MDSARICFIGVGGQKCASTWIYDVLADHPDVCLSQDKELDFFSNFWDRGYAWYMNQFDGERAKLAVAVGEVSPSYLSDSDAASRAAQYNRNMKVIVTLRNPLDRAYSNHKHNIRQGFVPGNDLSFEKSLAENPTYIEHGYYGKYLGNWLRHFPKQQVLVILFEDIVADPVGVAASVYRFLDVSDDFVSKNLRKKSNESVAVANVRMARIVDDIRIRFRSSRLSSWIWDVLHLLGIRAMYRALNMRDVETAIPKMLPATRKHLADTYRADVELLESILGRPLTSWME
jgi:hypothetical protein